MTTFDGKNWTAYLAGEFVMYKDNRRQIAVSKVNIFSFICILMLAVYIYFKEIIKYRKNLLNVSI